MQFPIRMSHPNNGFMHAYNSNDLEYLKKLGWTLDGSKPKAREGEKPMSRDELLASKDAEIAALKADKTEPGVAKDQPGWKPDELPHSPRSVVDADVKPNEDFEARVSVPDPVVPEPRKPLGRPKTR